MKNNIIEVQNVKVNIERINDNELCQIDERGE